MASKSRGIVVSEDKRTERFMRRLLGTLGTGQWRYRTCPNGSGAADAWVQAQYPLEVRELRRKNFQKDLALIVVLDADDFGREGRRRDLARRLEAEEIVARDAEDNIAVLIPARNIETWLLGLLGLKDLDETSDYKRNFERDYAQTERESIRKAVEAWSDIDVDTLVSLGEGKAELGRL